MFCLQPLGGNFSEWLGGENCVRSFQGLCSVQLPKCELLPSSWIQTNFVELWYNFHHLLLFFLPRLKSSNSIKSRAPFPLLALSFTPQSMFIFVILYFKIITTVEPCNFHRIFSLCGKIFCVHNQKIELGVKERAFSNLHRICWPQTHKSLVGVHSSQTVNIYTVEIVHLRS